MGGSNRIICFGMVIFAFCLLINFGQLLLLAGTFGHAIRVIRLIGWYTLRIDIYAAQWHGIFTGSQTHCNNNRKYGQLNKQLEPFRIAYRLYGHTYYFKMWHKWLLAVRLSFRSDAFSGHTHTLGSWSVNCTFLVRIHILLACLHIDQTHRIVQTQTLSQWTTEKINRKTTAQQHVLDAVGK